MAIVTLPLPIQLINGQVSDGGQVLTDLNAIASNVNANAAKNGVNNDITQLTALTSIVSGLSLTGASLLNCSFTNGSIVGTTIDSTSTGVTQALGTNTTQLATTAFVAAQAFSGILPALAAPTGASLIGNQPAGTIPSTTVQAALNYLDTKTVDTISSINGGQIAGLRNRIINGDMRIDQRNSGSAVTPTVSTYLIDRFFTSITQASKLTFQQVADAPPGFKFSLKCTVASQFSPGAADSFVIDQRIEGQNIVDWQLGTATSQTITATVWVKGSIAGTYSCHFYNSAINRSYIGTITVSAAWVKQTVTLTLDTTGTWLTDNGIGMGFGIDLGSGSNFNTVAGAWQPGNFFRTSGSVTFVNQINGSTLNIAGIQIELGSLSTPFEQRPIGVELMLSQRYLPVVQVDNGRGYPGQAFAATIASVYVPFIVTPRVAPTGILTSGAISFSTANGGSTGTVAFTSATTSSANIGASGASGLVAGNVTAIGTGGGVQTIQFTGCEL